MDTVEANAKFARKHGFPFQLLCDTDRKVGLAYGAVEDKGGRARRVSYLVGEDGRIRKVWPRVKPAEHPDEVLAAIG